MTAALTNGVAAYLFGDTAYQYALAGNNIILVVFIHVYVHLQHTHLWISFRGLLGRVFISPAHHQVHHSTNPVHFNKNLGSCLAVWDWLFGTLHVAGQAAREAHLRRRAGLRRRAHHHRRISVADRPRRRGAFASMPGRSDRFAADSEQSSV